ncbi:phospholipase B1, membrane-associated-like [Latimeria chalumnae]|uniref:phospholipase B1, membrane-associated-like n=1 Tax=Latimeria chalumnae TaxID=7897 RepID=UPI00313D1317
MFFNPALEGLPLKGCPAALLETLPLDEAVRQLMKMDFLILLKVVTVLSFVDYTHGSDRWEAYVKGVQDYSSLYGSRDFSEKVRRETTLHPPLQCPDMGPSPTIPTSVEKVKAADVKIVAALGDSITTAIGANASNVFQLVNEYRQLSWSIGGYGTFADVITLPNILKLFNPDLVGGAKNKTRHKKPHTLNETGFNLAVTGANSYEFPAQARNLIHTLKTYPGINFAEDWKLVTIFIGANDLCDYCKNKTLFSADSFIFNLTVTLDMLYKEL